MFQLVFVHRVPTSTTTATGRKFPNLGELKLSKNYFIICLKFSSLRMRREFVFESGVGRLAAQLMQSAYSVFYHEHVLNKEPGHLSFSLSLPMSLLIITVIVNVIVIDTVIFMVTVFLIVISIGMATFTAIVPAIFTVLVTCPCHCHCSCHCPCPCHLSLSLSLLLSLSLPMSLSLSLSLALSSSMSLALSL